MLGNGFKDRRLECTADSLSVATFTDIALITNATPVVPKLIIVVYADVVLITFSQMRIGSSDTLTTLGTLARCFRTFRTSALTVLTTMHNAAAANSFPTNFTDFMTFTVAHMVIAGGTPGVRFLLITILAGVVFAT